MEIETKRKLNIEDGGYVFFITVIAYLVATLIFQGVIAIVAGVQGRTVEEVSSSAGFTFAGYCVCGITILLTSTVYSKAVKLSPLTEIGVKKPFFDFWIIAVVGVFGVMFGLGFLNDAFIGFLEKFGYKSAQTVLPPKTPVNVVLAIVCVCIVPAVLEEVLFRGFVLRSLQIKGNSFAIIVSGLLFAVFHMNPAQTLYQLVVGCFYSLIAVKSRSIIPTIIMHFLNNFVIVVAYYFIPVLFKSYWFVSVIAMALFVAVVVWLFVRDKFTGDVLSKTVQQEKQTTFAEMVGYVGGFIACALIWACAL